MNLAELETRTRLTFDTSFPMDMFDLNGKRQSGAALERVLKHLNLLRGLRGISTHAHILSENTSRPAQGSLFASGFAALTLAAVTAMGLDISEMDLSRLARRGSGSACDPSRRIQRMAKRQHDFDSFAFSIAPPEHWELVDCIALIEAEQKKTGSSEGHTLARAAHYKERG